MPDRTREQRKGLPNNALDVLHRERDRTAGARDQEMGAKGRALCRDSVLYGSRVPGSVQAKSDIDLANTVGRRSGYCARQLLSPRRWGLVGTFVRTLVVELVAVLSRL